MENQLFCKTIYNAVKDELGPNNDTSFFRDINIIEDNEKKIRLIHPDKQYEYRELLVSINLKKQELNPPPTITIMMIRHAVFIIMNRYKKNYFKTWMSY